MRKILKAMVVAYVFKKVKDKMTRSVRRRAFHRG